MAETRRIIEKIQNYIYPRRPRVKEFFVDYDPLRHGVVSLARFNRCVSTIGASLTEAEIEHLVHVYQTESGDVDFVQFTNAVDEVFGPTKLEKTPMKDVLPPGATVPPKFTPGKIEDDDKLHAIMHRIALLENTRGVSMKYCFQDFDRADSASLLVPRRSGKVIENHFRRLFPFKGDFSEEEMRLIIHRYRDGPDRDLVNYQALHDDVTDANKNKMSEQLPTSHFIPRPNNLTWTQDTISAEERIQARIVERRVRPRQYYQDFDPLRKGYISKHQARTVFSILNLDVSEQDFEEVCNKYCRPRDEMFHYDAFQTKIDEAFTTRGLEMTPLARPVMPSPESTVATRKNRTCLSDSYHHDTHWVEQKIASRVKELELPIIQIFKDYDPQAQGHLAMSQFGRVISTFGLGLSLEDIEAVALKYCDRGNTRDVNYVEFSQKVDAPTADYILAAKQNASTYEGRHPAQYFDKNGEVIPAH